jgi:MOSC domain-containing protein YiiM
MTGQFWPVVARKLNLNGDGQGDTVNHGGPDKAVCLYPWDNTLYWMKELRREDLSWGSFGENLSAEGLGESEVAIGDEFAIGTARFMVTQPRLPCVKLATALNDPSVPKLLLDSGRTGFYLRVLQQGILQPGDPIYPLASREAARVTVAELVEIYRTKRAEPDQIDRILKLTALPESWKERVTSSTVR